MEQPPSPTTRARASSRTSTTPRLRRYTTPTEHIDGLVIDEDDHHPVNDTLHEEEEERGRRLAGDGETGSNSTIVNPEADAEAEDPPVEADATRNAPGTETEHVAKKDVVPSPSDLEKGFRGGEKPARGLTRDSQVEKWQDPETRAWKDNIVTFDTRTDQANPKNWTSKKKLRILFCYGVTTMCSTFASSVFSSGSSYVAAEYGVSTEVMVLGVSLFVAGYIVGPLIFAPLSTTYGRKMAILPAMFIMACFSAATATAENLQTIFITRFFAGVFGSAPVVAVGGVLADMYDQRARGSAVVFYSLAVVAGPTLGPIIGGAVSQSYLGWRWTMYLTVILIASVLVVDFFVIEETFAPVILTKKAKALRRATGRWELHSRGEESELDFRQFLDQNVALPLKMIVTEPMVLLICLYNSFTYGILYMLFSFIPLIYEGIRGWNTLVGALPFLSTLIGCFAAAAINLAYAKYFFIPHLEAHGGKARPEMRLPPMMIGSISFPIGFFIVAWTSSVNIHWFPSIVGFFFIGMSFLLIFQAGINYLIDSYTSVSASAVAANTLMRSISAVGLPFAAQPMFRTLGVQWAGTLLGCIAVLLGASPFIFFKFGPHLRARSKRIKDL